MDIPSQKMELYRQAVKALPMPSISGSSVTISPSTYDNTSRAQLFELTGGLFTPGNWWQFTNNLSCMAALRDCPVVSTVLGRTATAFLNGIPKIINSRANESNSPGSKTLLKLLTNPNGFETGQQFMAKVYITTMIIGRCVILPLLPIGSNDFSQASALAVVPPKWLSYFQKTTMGMDFESGGLEYITIQGIARDFKPNELIIIDDLLPNLFCQGEPMSRLGPLQEHISNVIGALQSRGAIIKQRGPRGALVAKVSTMTGGPVPMKPDERERIEAGYAARYGLMGGQFHTMVSESPMEYLNMGFDVRQMGLFEEVKDSTIAIANGLGYPPYLLGIEGSTFTNQKDAGKFLYTQNIIPAANSIGQQLGSYFQPLTDRLTFDYSHLPELQLDAKEKAEASKVETEDLILQFKMNLLTLAEFKTKKGLEPLPGDENIKYSDIKELIEFKPTNNGQGNTAGQDAPTK